MKDQRKFNRRGIIHLSLGFTAGLLSTRIISDDLINDEYQPAIEQLIGSFHPISTQDYEKKERKLVQQPTEEKLNSISGTYELEQPINGMESITIRQEKRQLYLEMPGYKSIKLKPAGKDRYSARLVGRIYHFYNNEKGQTEKVSIQRMSTGREEGIGVKKV